MIVRLESGLDDQIEMTACEQPVAVAISAAPLGFMRLPWDILWATHHPAHQWLESSIRVRGRGRFKL
jgi:hypothetical protein